MSLYISIILVSEHYSMCNKFLNLFSWWFWSQYPIPIMRVFSYITMCACSKWTITRINHFMHDMAPTLEITRRYTHVTVVLFVLTVTLLSLLLTLWRHLCRFMAMYEPYLSHVTYYISSLNRIPVVLFKEHSSLQRSRSFLLLWCLCLRNIIQVFQFSWVSVLMACV